MTGHRARHLWLSWERHLSCKHKRALRQRFVLRKPRTREIESVVSSMAAVGFVSRDADIGKVLGDRRETYI